MWLNQPDPNKHFHMIFNIKLLDYKKKLIRNPCIGSRIRNLLSAEFLQIAIPVLEFLRMLSCLGSIGVFMMSLDNV